MSKSGINMEMDPILIRRVVDRFGDEFRAHRELYGNHDMEEVTQNEWSVQRYLSAANLDAEKAFLLLQETMRWRKTSGVNTRTDTDFPLEFYKMGAYFPYAVDRCGRVVIYARVKLYKRFPKVADIFRQFIIHIINKTDSQSQKTGWAMVWDMSGAGPSNFDLSFIKYMMATINHYFPEGMAYLLMYGLKPIMSGVMRFGLSLIPKESRIKIKFVSNDELYTYIAPENLPDFMGGKCMQSYRLIPEGARNAKEVGIERGIALDDINKVLKYYDKYLQN